MPEELVAVAEGQVIAAVDCGEVTDVGCGWTPVEPGSVGVFDEGGGVGGDAGVPCGAVVEVAGVGVVGAELEAVGEAAADIDLKRCLLYTSRCV